VTPEGLALDASVFRSGSPLTLYRLARTRYANLSGVGAASYPGRWNRAGQEAIYASLDASTLLLEKLAHTHKDLIPSNLSMMRMRLAGAWRILPDVVVPTSWVHDEGTDGTVCVCSSLAVAKSALDTGILHTYRRQSPLALAVPSVIAPVWNVVLYPEAHGFWEHVTLEGVEPFEFDPRLFPDNTPVEAS
jgi:RES domain-containing protein